MTTKSAEAIQQKEASQLGFYIALVSWGMLFAALFLSYALFRFQNTQWPPMGFEKVSLIWPSLSTLFIAISSLTLHRYQKSFEMIKRNDAKFFLWGTLILGIGFLVTQKLLWLSLESSGLMTSSGIFASILHGFTWIHAGHVVLGLLGLFYLLKTLKVENLGHVQFENKVENIIKFWHFLGIIWALMFVVLFLI